MKNNTLRKPSGETRSSKRLTVMDLFCGAGGFSEGFKSAGFKVVYGIDKWGPALDTFNGNFGLNMQPKNILYYEGRPDRIEELPDTDVIIGSPPCVSFSYSNQLRDKKSGMKLIRTYLAIVAVKKHKPSSQLKAWFMENVPNALKSLKPAYSFRDLRLTAWCRRLGIDPHSTALTIHDNAKILDAADYGVPQVRKRLFVHEYVRTRGKQLDWVPSEEKRKVSLSDAISKLPSPTCVKSSRRIQDPLYPAVSIPLRQLTDHFYETGAYELHWRESKYLKRNHPYMGRMAFPERRDKPSRTIMANSFPRSREALLYESEWNRRGNGEYRGPTVREAATLMGFPITYQFSGAESAKWMLVGNAVCPLLAYGLARQLCKKLGRRPALSFRRKVIWSGESFPNLNEFRRKSYNDPPKRMKWSRFRRQPLKAASMAVTLSNYDVRRNGSADGIWRCSITYGIGKGYRVQQVKLQDLHKIKGAIKKIVPEGPLFIEHISNGFAENIAPAGLMQKLHERNSKLNGYVEPSRLVEQAGAIVNRFAKKDEEVVVKPQLFMRKRVPKSQLFALFAVCKIAHTAESKRGKRR